MVIRSNTIGLDKRGCRVNIFSLLLFVHIKNVGTL